MAAKSDARLYEPSPRGAHYSFSVGNSVYVCFGDTGVNSNDAFSELSRQVEVYNCPLKTWAQKKTTGTPPPGLVNGACASINGKLYTYGGDDLRGLIFTGTLNHLDTSTMEWKLLSSDIGPMKKLGAGIVAVNENTLGLFGGKGIPTSPTQPGATFVKDSNYTDGSGWTNEFHIFNISNGTWSSPPMTGTRPPPCSGFSFTTVDGNRAVVFGGLQPGCNKYVNDVYIIDFNDMNWTKIEPRVGESWPVGRVSHAACCLSHGGEHPQLLISGGLDNDDQVLKDCWVLDLASRKWKKLTLPDDVQTTRFWHSITASTLGPGLVEVIMFGGCDDWDNKTLISATTILRFKFTREWNLVGVVTNRQRAVEVEFGYTQTTDTIISTKEEVGSADSASLRQTIRLLQQRVERAESATREAERRAKRAESATRETETTVHTLLQRVEDARKEAQTERQGRQQAERQAHVASQEKEQVERQAAIAEEARREAETALQTSMQEAQTERQGRQQAEIQARVASQEKEQAERQARVASQEKEQAERWAAIAEEARREAETTLQTSMQRAETDLRATEERLRETSRLLDEANQRAQQAERRVLEAAARGREAEHWIVQRGEIMFTERELGRGGWGVVKVAKFRGINVAAKQLFQQISQFYRLSFIREMNMAARIRHPNLVQFIGATLDNEPIILTELMSTSLRAVLERGPITHALTIAISLDVARALNYLHLMQPDPIIHRDISSANVLLDPLPNNHWKAKISDYGSVNLLRQLQTVGPGSPVYAAPEASIPALQSPKMDIFSFGILLIEMITDTFPEVALRTTLIDSIRHRDLLELVQRCINQERDNRLSSTEIIAQLCEM